MDRFHFLIGLVSRYLLPTYRLPRYYLRPRPRAKGQDAAMLGLRSELDGICVPPVAIESSPLNYAAQVIAGQTTEDFLCPICLALIMEPSQISFTSPCRHFFCTSCIEAWYSTSTKCPVCRGNPFSVSEEVPANFLHKLERIQAFCPYKSASGDPSDACRWKGSIVSLKNHTETECLFSRLRCPNNCSPLRGDDTRFQSDAANNSNISNPRNVVPELFSGAELPGHRLICPLGMVQCPSKCSDAFFIARKDLPRHQKYSCMKRMVKCLLCNQEMMASDLRQHLNDSARVHLHPSTWLNGDLPEVMIRLLETCNKVKRYDMIADVMLHSEAISGSLIHMQQAGTGQTLLYRASSNGDDEVVKALLSFDVSKKSEIVMITSSDGVSPLMASSKCGYKVAELLLKANSSEEHLLLTDRHGQSALSYAIANGNSDMVQLLLKLNNSTRHLRTVSDSTLCLAPLQVVKLFLDVWCSSTERLLLRRSSNGRTLLMEMVLFAPVSRTKLLVDYNSSTQHFLERDDQGQTALMLASKRNKTESVELLLNYNSNEQHLLAMDKANRTALILSCTCGYPEVVNLLLKYSSTDHLLATDRENRTALMFACAMGHAEVVKLLLKYNSTDHLLATEKENRTALMFACAMGHTEVVKLLLKYSSTEQHLLAADCKGRTALLLALAHFHVEVAELLLNSNSSNRHLLAADETGQTPLMLASWYGRKHLVGLLLRFNSNKEHLLAKNFQGHTALMLAKKYRHSGVFRLLQVACACAFFRALFFKAWNLLKRAFFS